MLLEPVMPITPFLDGHRFDPEATRVLGVDFVGVCAALRIGDRSTPAAAAAASKIISLALRGERDPDQLCALALSDLRLVAPPPTDGLSPPER
jgi:hypothetical protein